MSIVVARDLPTGKIEIYGPFRTIILTPADAWKLHWLLKIALEAGVEEGASYEDISRAANPFTFHPMHETLGN